MWMRHERSGAPTLYDAHHEVVAIRLLGPRLNDSRCRWPGLRTGDYLALSRKMAEPSPGDLCDHVRRRLWAVQAGRIIRGFWFRRFLVNGSQYALCARANLRGMIGSTKFRPVKLEIAPAHCAFP